MTKRLATLLLLFSAAPAIGAGQTAEMVFTPGVAQQAVALKAALRGTEVDTFDALTLVGASPERKKAYADQMTGVTAVVIVGEDALKASADVQFTVPVILVNAAGRSAARNRIIRVFSATSAAASSAKPVSAATAMFEVMKAGKEVALAGDVGSIVHALIASLK